MSSRARAVARTGVAVVLLAIAIRGVDVKQALASFTPSIALAMVAIQPFMLITFSGVAYRFMLLLDHGSASFTQAFRAQILAAGLTVLVPGRIPELVKATYARENAGVSLMEGIGAIVLERVCDVLCLGLIGALALYLSLPNVRAIVVWLLLAGAVMTVVMLALYGSRLASPIAKVLPASFENHIKYFFDNIEIRAGSFRYLKIVFLSILVWAVTSLKVYAYLWVVTDGVIAVEQAVLVIFASTIGGAIHILPGGFGTYEMAVILTLRGYGYEVPEALAIAVGLHVAQLVLSVGGSFFILSRERTGVAALVARIRNFDYS